MFDPGAFTTLSPGADCSMAMLAQVKLRIDATDTDDDALIGELIEQVSVWIENYTGRRFCPDDAATYVFDTVPGYVLRIPRGIRTITSMGVNNTVHQPDASGSYTTVAAADRLMRPKTQDNLQGWPYTEVHISRGVRAGTIASFGRIDNGCTITGDFGFEQTPNDVQSVCIDAVVAAYNVRKMGASGVIGAEDIAAVPWARFFGSGSPQRGTLDKYRQRSMS